MEDPWADAWGDSSKPSSSTSSVSPIASSSTWSAPSVSTTHGDNEDDISTPTWSTEPTTHWDATDVKETSLWDDNTLPGWNSTRSTYGGISFGIPVVDGPEISFPSTPDESSRTSFSIPTASKDDYPPPSPPPRELPSPSPLPSAVNSFIPVPEIIDDGFGTFETAGDRDDLDSDWPSPPAPVASLPSTDVDAWGATWQEADSNSVRTGADTEEFDDAWERAKQQKRKRDLHIPSAMLTTIIRNFDELSDDLWPDGSSPVAVELDNHRSVDIESLGLSSIYHRLVPDEMTLPPNPQFSKTFVSKRLTEALKTTRHVPITRSSPMAIYMASKGSTSWEVSIKSRPNVLQDDLAPAGWRVVDTSKDDALSTADEKKKTGGGLFSFFGRRATTSLSESRSPRPLSPAISTTTTSQQSSSPRASVDCTKTTNAAQSNRATPTSSLTTPITTSQSTEASDSNSSITAPPIVQRAVSDVMVQESSPPPSAVSRFLGRFSSRSSTLTANKDALALSSDDLEFLSDVPILANEPHNSKDLDALSMMIRAPPLPTALPAPLPPPPTQPLRNGLTVQHDRQDPFSFFDSPNPESKSTPVLGPVEIPTLMTPTLMAPTSPVTYQRPVALSSTSTPHPPSSLAGPQGGHSRDRSLPSFEHPTMGVDAGRTSGIAQASHETTKSSNSSKSSLPPLLPNQSRGPFASSQRAANAQPRLSNGLHGSVPTHPPPPASKAYPSFPEPRGSVDLEDDEFSDFLSSPARSTPSIPLSLDNFATGGLQSRNTYATNNKPSTSIISFDSFDGDFVSPPKANVPPQPPAKLPALYPTSRSPVPVTSKNIPPLPSQRPTHVRKVSRQADHARTLSLLETAAARKTWLSPPSPLPQALPPPGVSNDHSSGTTTLGDGSTMQAQQAQAVTQLSVPIPQLKGPSQLWTLPPPPSVSHLKHGTPSGTPPPLPYPVAATANTKSAAVSTAGGLSAQDLSFFEGL